MGTGLVTTLEKDLGDHKEQFVTIVACIKLSKKLAIIQITRTRDSDSSCFMELKRLEVEEAGR